MKSTYNYKCNIVADRSLDIQNIGNCVIDAIDALNRNYYLIVKTVLGTTYVIEYGPTLTPNGTVPSWASYSFRKFDYSEYKIDNIIDNFLNNSKYAIVDAQAVSIEEIKHNLRGFLDYIDGVV